MNKEVNKDIQLLRLELLKVINESGYSRKIILATISELVVDAWMYFCEQQKPEALDGLSRSINVVMEGKYK